MNCHIQHGNCLSICVIAQWDILEFSRNAKHVSPEWPAGYWPGSPSPPEAKAWEKSLKRFARDLAAMKRLVTNPRTDLFTRIPHGTGQTILREALLVADHNAYHLGQVILVRRLLALRAARHSSMGGSLFPASIQRFASRLKRILPKPVPIVPASNDT